MRTIVDIPDEQVRRLDATAQREGISRAALVRRAVEKLLAEEDGDGIKSAFGAWKHKGIRADDYIHELRAEWDR